jgi:hypothetical protein
VALLPLHHGLKAFSTKISSGASSHQWGILHVASEAFEGTRAMPAHGCQFHEWSRLN